MYGAAKPPWITEGRPGLGVRLATHSQRLPVGIVLIINACMPVCNQGDVAYDASYYESIEECFLDRAKLLTNSRYAPAMKFKDNWVAYAAAIHKAGYATDPWYTYLLVERAYAHGIPSLGDSEEASESLDTANPSPSEDDSDATGLPPVDWETRALAAESEVKRLRDGMKALLG